MPSYLSPWTSLITLVALFVYFAFTINIGRARYKYKIQPPQMTGNEDFERVVRVQQNTLEQLVIFVPALWLFSFFVNPLWGAGIGAVWILGRILFAWGYYQAAEKRRIGFAITSLATITLLFGAFGKIILTLVNGKIVG